MAAFTTVALRDPNEPGSYPLCPFRWATGLDCPGCGALRAIHALTAGDAGRALGHNALVVLAIPVMLLHYAVWARPQLAQVPLVARATAWTGRSRLVWALVGVVLAFAVARNLPWAPFSALHS